MTQPELVIDLVKAEDADNEVLLARWEIVETGAGLQHPSTRG